MKKHPVSIDSYDTLESIAIAVGKLRYDKLAEFFLYLQEEMERQQKKMNRLEKLNLRTM